MGNKIIIPLMDIPPLLKSIPNAPKALYVQGIDISEILSRPRVAIVGSRKVTAYGKSVTTKLASELAQQGIVIVSGLALGVDALAHRAALDAGGLTVAILPNSLNRIYPNSHRQLAQQITQQGVLVTEYEDGTDMPSYKGNFIARNRIVSGISDAVLITEASLNSGTLHTANFAKKQGRKVFAVPGNITSPTSAGTNQLIQAGATLITNAQDIFVKLGITQKQPAITRAKRSYSNPNEQIIIGLLRSGITDGGELYIRSKLDLQLFNQSLTMLEITEIICPLGNNQWKLN